MTLNLPHRFFVAVFFLMVAVTTQAQPSLLPQTGSSTNITLVVMVASSVIPAGQND